MDDFKTCELLKIELTELRQRVKKYEKLHELDSENEAKYRSYINSSPDGLFIVDNTGKYIEVNPAGCSMLGFSEHELLQISVQDISVLEEPKFFKKLLETGDIKAEIMLKKKDGSKLITELHAVTLGNNCFIGIVRDITKHKQAEEALRKSEELYRMIFDNSPLGIIHFDQNGVITTCNDKSVEIMGSSKKALIGFNMLVDFRDKSMKVALQTALEGKAGNYEGNYLSVTGNKLVRLRASFNSIFGDDGSFGGGVAVFEDITKRRKAEEALFESKQHLALIVNGISDAVVLLAVEPGSHFRILKMNNSYLKIIGMKEDQVIGKFVEEVFPKSFTDILINNYVSALSAQKPFNFEEKLPYGVFDTTLIPITNSTGEATHIIVTSRDITEKKKMDEHFLKVEKLESVGLLAGGIAHDFNNILTVLIGNASLARWKLDKTDNEEIQKTVQLITEIEKASLRAKDLTQQLLTFAKGGNPILTTTSLGETIKESAQFALTGSNVRSNFDFPDELWPVKIDQGQFHQVINNLIINAIQAMKDGGSINISSENINIKAHHLLPLKSGEYVKISFRDCGEGIPPENISKLFDPYFSTKQMGSGLGLTTTFSIINKHSGCITVESELGVGSTFYIYLPASKNEVIKKPDSALISFVGKGRVLVMDDDKMLRFIISEMLKHLSYDVTCAKDGLEAIEKYTTAKLSGNSFNVVIMDLTIPGGMGGGETIKKLQEIDIDVKAIVSSGYHNDPIMANYKDYGFKAVLAKPYTIEQLGELLRNVVSDDANLFENSNIREKVC